MKRPKWSDAVIQVGLHYFHDDGSWKDVKTEREGAKEGDGRDREREREREWGEEAGERRRGERKEREREKRGREKREGEEEREEIEKQTVRLTDRPRKEKRGGGVRGKHWFNDGKKIERSIDCAVLMQPFH